MDLDDEEFEELRRVDGLRSDNPVLRAWLERQRGAFEGWRVRHEGVWDFRPDSLDRLEDLVRASYGSYEEARADEDGDLLPVAAWYTGEVHNRHFGTVWQYHPDSPAAPGPRIRPFVTPPWDRLFDYRDEDGIEDDARPKFTPMEALFRVLVPADTLPLRDGSRYEPTN
ncbi:hypothetical protein ACIQNU_27760 [Streptomyces sp. NPDC091292]|uniref:hypothetical protein n=1 Tax=Streptomyces sp. NPDC091292 TaxID=3365991 RepID=UPI00382B55A8